MQWMLNVSCLWKLSFSFTHTHSVADRHLLSHTNTDTVLVPSPRPRWLTAPFFRSSKHHLWADAITSVPSTCQVSLPALMVAAERAACGEGEGWTLDELLDPVLACVCQARITVHFPASSPLRYAQPSLSAGVFLQKSSATTQGCISLLKLTKIKQPPPQL